MNYIPFFWLAGALASCVMAVQSRHWLGKTVWISLAVWLVIWFFVRADL